MLRFIALTVLAYFIFRWLDRMFGAQPRQRPTQRTRSSQGAAPKKSKVNKNVGEYIDYEEVKEEK